MYILVFVLVLILRLLHNKINKCHMLGLPHKKKLYIDKGHKVQELDLDLQR
jgi:hypothetical protein